MHSWGSFGVCGLLLLQMSHAATSALCRSIKLQCELYPSRQIAICLDPYCGLGFALWCLCRWVEGGCADGWRVSVQGGGPWVCRYSSTHSSLPPAS